MLGVLGTRDNWKSNFKIRDRPVKEKNKRFSNNYMPSDFCEPILFHNFKSYDDET